METKETLAVAAPAAVPTQQQLLAQEELRAREQAAVLSAVARW